MTPAIGWAWAAFGYGCLALALTAWLIYELAQKIKQGKGRHRR